MNSTATPAPTHVAPSDDELRLLLERSGDVLLRGSTDGILEWASSSIVRVLGWTPDQVIGRRFIEFVHPLDHHAVRAAQEGLGLGEQRGFEVRLRASDGAYRWIDVAVHPVIDADGHTTGRLARWHDIHHEVLQRQELHRALSQVRTTLDALLDPYIVLAAVHDDAGAIVDFIATEANEAACRFMKTTRVGFTSVSINVALGPTVAPGYERLFTRVLADGEPLRIDGIEADNGPDGSRRYYDIGVTQIDVDHVGFTWRDVTARVEHQRLRDDLTSMEALVEERDRVARDLHDGAVQQVYAIGMLLSALAARLSVERHREIDRIIDAHDVVVRQIRATILGLARPDLSTVRASQAVADAVAEAERGLRAQVVLHGHEAIDVLDDPLLVEHLLFSMREMLSNVARHAEASSVEVTIEVDLDAVTLTVSDDGVGIDPQHRRGYGLSNLGKRATLLGGEFVLHPGPHGGTEAIWRVPRNSRRT